MTRGPTARLFVAIDPPTVACEELAAWARRAVGAPVAPTARRPARAARVLEAQALHLTLCFLGSRPVEEIEPLASALGSCAWDACELSLGAPLWLPRRRPRALAVEVRDRAGELARLQETVTRALSHASGWRPERRGFRPHITVARMRPGATSARDAAGDQLSLPATPRLRFTAESIVLYRSWLAQTGATYEAIATCGLRPPAR
jgi:2'-5' RNA ligase